jgi:zinc protease
VATDTTKSLVAALTEFRADLFLTSGHATERDWQIGYKYRNGYFRCEEGVLYGLDTAGNKHRISSPNPKVYLPIGNCLMGHIDSTNAMALAFMNSAGVLQMMGYTVNTWYGYAGWGCLDYFIEQPGRFTFVEAFLANQVALMHRLETFFPDQAAADLDERGRFRQSVSVSAAAREAGLSAQDAAGLVYDRDTVAFYGDPGWVARMADGPLGWEQKLSHNGTEWIFEIIPRRGETSFQPLSFNGSQRGGRPFLQFFEGRLKNIEIVSGQELNPLVTDTFLLVPNPGKSDPSRSYKVVFRGILAQP